jgi:plasmid segregation protein ParM
VTSSPPPYAVDIGFGFTKATNGRDTIIFKSLSGDANDIQYWADFGASKPVDHIHVTIDGKSYFIGELAAFRHALAVGAAAGRSD